MAILVDRNTRLMVQGITGKLGSYYAERMLRAGTQVVAGVRPGKAGQSVHGVPIFESVCEAKAQTGADATILYVPPAHTRSAILEALEAQLCLILCIVDGVPMQDMLVVKQRLRQSQTVLVGPNSPGIITPGEFVAGFMVPQAFRRGPVGIVSRSGTLSYQTGALLSAAGIGQSTVLGIGGDPIVGIGFADVLELFAADPETRAIVLIGEIGGQQEELAAPLIRQLGKPVIAFIAGRAAPPGKRMGHAGAIIGEGRGTWASKVELLRAHGAQVAELLSEVPALVSAALAR